MKKMPIYNKSYTYQPISDVKKHLEKKQVKEESDDGIEIQEVLNIQPGCGYGYGFSNFCCRRRTGRRK